jgi:Domain of Unknown Function with PDB structure (DUF3862)
MITALSSFMGYTDIPEWLIQWWSGVLHEDGKCCKQNPVLPLLGMVLLMTVVGCSSPTENTNKSPGSANTLKMPSASSNSAGVTMANYDRLKTGIKYAEVVKALGKEGTEMSSSKISGIKTIMYKWDGEGFGANMNVMIQNNKLVSKAQFGLK